MKVLMVCTGNICRSPAAEGLARHHLAVAGLADQVQVESAGTHGYHIGEPPDPRMIVAAAARGYDIASQRAQRLTDEDYRRFDLIVAMDRGHLSILQSRMPGDAKADLLLFGGFVPGTADPDVPDPYYDEDRVFDGVLDLLEEGMPALASLVRERLAGVAG